VLNKLIINFILYGGISIKLLSIIQNNKTVLGIQTDQGILNLESILGKYPNNTVPTDIMEVINRGREAVKSINNYLDDIPKTAKVYMDEPSAWEPAITTPEKIICVGLNYRKHADETNSPYPKEPILFNKFNNTLTGHKHNIKVPKTTGQLDYEVELGIVIGKTAKEVAKEDAFDYVFGYVTANDLSARDLQFRTGQWLLGKSCDGFTPVGPYLVTSDEIEDPDNLHLKTTVNGKVRQESNTSDMIFDCKEIISYISKHMTLSPGDLILTGTPEGVVLGEPEEERIYLKPGDEVSVEIENLGKLTNRFISDN